MGKKTEASSESDLYSKMLEGIARFFLRRQVPFQHFVDLARAAYVRVAREELARTTSKINTSRISILTGISRVDVKNITSGDVDPERRSANLVSRVLNRWEQDKQYRDGSGRVRPLTYDSDNSEFYQLVASISQHLNPGTVLFELKRLELVEERGGKLKLLRAISKDDDSDRWRLQLAGMDMDTLLHAVHDNIEFGNEPRNPHYRTEYDNLVKSQLPEIKQWLKKEVDKFHERVRGYLSARDLDVNPEQEGEGGGRVVVSALGYIERSRKEDGGEASGKQAKGASKVKTRQSVGKKKK